MDLPRPVSSLDRTIALDQIEAMKTFIFGETSAGLPILGYRFQNAGPRALILGGVHGDEIEGVWAAHGLLRQFLYAFPYRLDLTLVPTFNLDGVLRKDRRNANGVDLNRNMPTSDWTNHVAQDRYYPGKSPNSEPETKALVEFLDHHRPNFIMSLHSWHPVLNVNGDCRPEAEEIQRHNGYRIDDSIGYPTPGCLGTYAGLEREMPTLTYEIERGQSQSDVLSVHVPAIQEALKVTEQRIHKG